MSRVMDPHEGSVMSLGIMYLKGGKSPLPALELTKHPFTKDVIRSMAGEKVKDAEAKAVADDLIWWHFESKPCPDCEGAGMIKWEDGYYHNCSSCHGMRRVDKNG